MTKLDEFSIIRIFQTKLGNKKFVSEDVEVFSLGKTKVIAKVDTLVESTDIPPKMKLADAARKSVVACVSDFAAKGIKPQYGIISLNLPKRISRLKVEEIANGFKNACNEFGIRILGGDTNSGKEIVLNVCIFGHSDHIVSRKGSKKDDLIFTTGPFGFTSLGLSIILGKKKTNDKVVKKSIKFVMKPKPRLDFGLKNKKYFSSSMDSSDGLSTTLYEMSRQGKKKFIINNIPLEKEYESYVKSHNLDLNKLIFYGGEEYEFVFTIPPKYKNSVLKNAKLLKTPIIEIGYVTTGRGVFLKDNDKMVRLKDKGWNHFK